MTIKFLWLVEVAGPGFRYRRSVLTAEQMEVWSQEYIHPHHYLTYVECVAQMEHCPWTGGEHRFCIEVRVG